MYALPSLKRWPTPLGYIKYFRLNSAEHDFFLFINVKMTTIVGILIFMSRKNNILGLI